MLVKLNQSLIMIYIYEKTFETFESERRVAHPIGKAISIELLHYNTFFEFLERYPAHQVLLQVFLTELGQLVQPEMLSNGLSDIRNVSELY